MPEQLSRFVSRALGEADTVCEELPMSLVRRRVRRAGVLVLLALAAACGRDSQLQPPSTGEPVSEPSLTGEPVSEPSLTGEPVSEPSLTGEPVSEPSLSEEPVSEPSLSEEPVSEPSLSEELAGSAAASEPPVEGGEFDIDEDTTLREVFGAFAGSEQACVRDAVGDDALESMLDISVLSEGGMEQSMAEIFVCLDPQTAREFFVSATMAAMIAGAAEEGLSTEVGSDERACIRDRFADVNVDSMVDVLVSESADPVVLDLLGCVPELAIESMLAHGGVVLEELTEQQRSCVRDLVADTDWTVLGAEEAPEWFALGFGLRACVPGFVSADSVVDPSPVSREDVADDHSNSREQATAVAVGETAAGDIQYATDADYFVFEADQGKNYQIDVTLGTLPDSVATLYDPEGAQLAQNDDHAGTAASRLYWQARASGSLYVAVEGWSHSKGTYTVAVAALDVVDDHADTFEGATPVTVGETAAGDIQYATDADYFVFEAELGQLYQIDITLETLSDSVASLYDPDDVWLTANNDIYAPRLWWQAQTSGSHYVGVAGYRTSTSTGTYTVAVTALDVVDDHSGTLEGATAVAVGETAAGDIQYPTDADYFVFEADRGQNYRIDVILGTLPESAANLRNPDGVWLQGTDDTSAPRFYLQARASGSHYLAVAGLSDSKGTYTVAVTALDVVDDHSGTLEGATPVTVGETAAGDIQYPTDADYFVFEAELGQLYQIDITLETLTTFAAWLRHPDGTFLTDSGNIDDTSVPRIYWEARDSGNLYVEIAGWLDDTGTYTLTIVTR